MYLILSLFVICALFAYGIETLKDSRQRNHLIILCLLFLTFVSGTRLCGGTDYPTYEGHYFNLPTFPDVLDPNKVNQFYEIGYTYFASFFKTLGLSFYGFCVIHALVFYTCLWKGLSRYTQHFGIVILVFLYKLFFYDTMISMRQSLTIAFFFIMIPYIEQRKWIKYYICAILVSTIHNGAYLLLVLYPLAYVHVTKRLVLLLNVIFIPTIFIGLAGIDVLGPIGQFLVDNASSDVMASKAEGYFSNDNLSPIGLFHTLEYFFIMFFFYKNINLINLKYPKVNISACLFLCLLPLFTLFRGSEILTREKDYFVIFYAVIIGYLIDVQPKKRFFYYTFITLLCAFGYYRYVALFDDGAFLKYESWLFNPFYSAFLN